MPASLTDLEGLTVYNSGNESDATTSIPAPLDNIVEPASLTVPNFETMDDMPALLTEEVAAPSEVSATRKKRIIPPVDCLKCRQEIKGKCSSCLIKELKSLVKEKDIENKRLQRSNSSQAKSIVRKDAKILKFKERIRLYRRKLDTSGHRVKIMSRYAQVCVSLWFYSGIIKYDVIFVFQRLGGR